MVIATAKLAARMSFSSYVSELVEIIDNELTCVALLVKECKAVIQT